MNLVLENVEIFIRKIHRIFTTIIKRIRQLRIKKIFSQNEEFRSDSENGYYLSVVKKSIEKEKHFNRFKKNIIYREILEHVSFADGQRYLSILEKRDDILEKALKTVLISDDLGGPVKYFYDGYSYPLSPTTLRYCKVASDLRHLFGNHLGKVAEIGCGYGGQALVNDQLLEVESAFLFDLPLVNQLIEKYLDSFLFHGSYKTGVINHVNNMSFDLVISNYAFSEMPARLQLIYAKKIMAESKSGYLTMNSGLGGLRSAGKLSVSELRSILPEFYLFEEEPITSPDNFIIAWGWKSESDINLFRRIT